MLGGAGLMLSGCKDDARWHMTDVAGSLPDLSFELTRARDATPVTGAAYRGRVALLYFGYTRCPDICPTTLSDLAAALDDAGAVRDRVAVLFVTVDPARDRMAELAAYAAAFAPEVDGLRGTPDQTIEVTRRYRVAYARTAGSAGEAYEVAHSSAVFVFDPAGRARLATTSTGDVRGIADDLVALATTPAAG